MSPERIPKRDWIWIDSIDSTPWLLYGLFPSPHLHRLKMCYVEQSTQYMYIVRSNGVFRPTFMGLEYYRGFYQYHSCWCLGPWHRQIISSHFTDYRKWRCHCTISPWISTNASLSTNEIKANTFFYHISSTEFSIYWNGGEKTQLNFSFNWFL